MSDRWLCGRFEFSLERPLLMGVVNVTPDSFSDGGQHVETTSAIAHAQKLVTEGAEILDIDPAWWEKKAIAQAHVRLIRAVFGNAERLTVFGTPVKATPGHGPAGLSTPANSSMSGPR